MVAVYLPAFPAWLSDLSLAAMLGAAILLLVVQMEHTPSLKRWLGAVAVIALFIGCRVYADAVIVSPCYGVEKYSWEWWALGCWGLF